MTIFEVFKHYATPWKPVVERPLSDEDKAVIASAEVVKGDYGLSVCFHMTYGGMTFISIDEDNSTAHGVGDKVDIDKIIYKELEKADPDGTINKCYKVVI